MKRYLAPILLTILLAALIAGNANAQDSVPDTHVAAARAAMSPAAAAKPWQIFNSVFRQQCTQPKPGARPEDEPVGSNVPLDPGEQKKLTPTPHDQSEERRVGKECRSRW